MRALPQIVADYVAVWNEGDPQARRRRIAEAWMPDGTTCYRLLDASGYAAIEERVAGSWAKWLGEGKYAFEARAFASHHDVVKVEFALVKVPDGGVEANGLSFLLLDDSGRIRHDYQFNPSANDAMDLAEGYVALLNEAEIERHGAALKALWADDGRLVTREASHTGRAAVGLEIARSLLDCRAQKATFAQVDRAQTHHHVARLRYPICSEAGDRVGANTEFLILDAAGRIRVDYRFSEAA